MTSHGCVGKQIQQKRIKQNRAKQSKTFFDRTHMDCFKLRQTLNALFGVKCQPIRLICLSLEPNNRHISCVIRHKKVVVFLFRAALYRFLHSLNCKNNFRLLKIINTFEVSETLAYLVCVNQLTFGDGVVIILYQW